MGPQNRDVTGDVGGGFGTRNLLFREFVLVIWAARRLGRPVKWTSDRSEAFLADAHGRDHVTHAEMAFGDDGKIIALKVKTIANLGAYMSTFSSSVPTYLYATLLSGQYDIPAIYCEVDAVYTNTVPVDAYRGAGRPEATFVVERLVEVGARELHAQRDASARGESPHEQFASPLRRHADGHALQCLHVALCAGQFASDVDAALAAQNAAIALESLGLGCCYIGAMRNDPERVAKLLGLPPQCFVLFGLCVGYATDQARGEVKPRLAQPSAVARPMPRLPPVMKTVLPFNEFSRPVI